MAGALPPEAVAHCPEAPADITFVDAEGMVRYFSQYRIFARPADCLGREVLLCHNEETRPVVARLLAELRDGWRDEACFLSQKNGRAVDVRYLAVHDERRGYVGCLEVAQWAEPGGSS